VLVGFAAAVLILQDPPAQAAIVGAQPAVQVTSKTLAAGATSTPCITSPLPGRTQLFVSNQDSATIYVSPIAASTSTGFPIAGSSTTASFDLGYRGSDALPQLYCYSVAGTVANGLRTLEIR
jgi:hypothetical protein